jgi:hypothetical protein
MMKHVLTLAAVAAMASLAMAGIALEFDDETDFAEFSTYVLNEGRPAHRESARRQIMESVEASLNGKGLQKVEADPDIYVVTHVLIDLQSIEELADPDYWEFVTGVSGMDAYDIGAATLVVDIVDAKRKKVVWRAVATDTVKGSAEQMRRKIDKVVRKLFKRYPPEG